MPETPRPGSIYRFGPFRLDAGERILERDGRLIAVKPKTFDTLLLLVQNPGHLLTKEELLAALWPDTFVEESNLAQHVFLLRKALGDGSNGDRYIETVPKIGYRFRHEVRRDEADRLDFAAAAPAAPAETAPDSFATSEPAAVQPAVPARRTSRWLILVLSAAAAFAAGIFAISEKSNREAGTRSALAYEHYRQASFLIKPRDNASLKKAVELFQRSIEADPTFAAAYAGLADCYLSLGPSFPDAIPKAKAAAVRAVSLDGALAPAHSSLCFEKLFFEWDWRGAESECRRAVALDPRSSRARQRYAFALISEGRADDALREMREARRIDPGSAEIRSDAGLVLYFARRYDESLVELREAVARDPDNRFARGMIAAELAQKGLVDQAIEEIRRGPDPAQLERTGEIAILLARAGRRAEALSAAGAFLDPANRDLLPSDGFAGFYASVGDPDKAFEWLARAVDEKRFFLIFLKVDPQFDPVRADPRFAAVLARIGLPS